MKHKNKIVGMVGETVAVGAGSIVGIGVMGSLGKMSGMPKESNAIIGVAGTGLGMLNAAQVMKNTNTVLGGFKSKKKGGYF